ncbi:putative phosphoribosylformylglycinamidine synthase protein [Eutypa lata UCREL1]|uniref:Phosphoribosylformylglycinamidine synthase n=1 Tax=Eutypa lata (strain UCR-EL1) TaxID=1287681 RepID=M7SKD2_EUTLA|nr:putative phosphoribosylformylglycinamidine synthase protein [Eutypa lata UCREL1]
MGYEVLLGESCFTVSEAQKLSVQINQKSDAQVQQISGQWLYYVDSENKGNSGVENTLERVKQLVQASNVASTGIPSKSSDESGKTLVIYIAPRNTPSPWSSKATSIAQVCGVKARIERGRVVTIEFDESFNGDTTSFRDILHDRMTESFTESLPQAATMFAEGARGELVVVDIFADERGPLAALQDYNKEQGLGLDIPNMEYLVEQYKALGRSPNDVELFMFAQVNSEHCRHHVFNASWTIDGVTKGQSLFEMIKHTHKSTPDFVVSAYSDNAAVPFPGAATGSGGEIRDEGAVGRGSTPKAGLCGFWVSDLLIPDNKQPWEVDIGRPGHYASSIDIMLEAPIGSARFNNEFGRPSLTGTFRTLLTKDADSEAAEYRGYHKPIMIAGGIGSVRPQHAIKEPAYVHDGAHVIVLGGPAMLIGLGGGAASSNTGSEASADLDFNSVQRGNPEMERRAQMVINTCVALGQESPIAFIHDVGAGGLSNAIPELVKDAGFGGKFELRQVESADNSMSPLQIWCNEAQERYVLLVNRDALNRFTSICRRERCGFSVVGHATAPDDYGKSKLVLTDREPTIESPVDPINLPMDVLFPPGRRISKEVQTVKKNLHPFSASDSLKEQHGTTELSDMVSKATELVFSLPSVGSKLFLITIGDRTVGGLTVRDQLVAGASARMAVAESLMNLGAADIKPGSFKGDLKRVKLSANWMAAVNHPGEGAELYEAVQAIGLDLCPQLGISIPVGKDSTSMKASWKDRETEESRSVTAPVSLVISAFSLVEDVRSTWTPQLRRVEEVGESVLLYVDLAKGRQAMGGSALAQCLGQIGNEAPDVRDVELIRDYFDAMWQLHQENVVLAYHDRSDGGLLTTVAEMMFAGRCGAEISVDSLATSESGVLDALFNEELGAVFQIRKRDENRFKSCFATCGPPAGLIRTIGYIRPTPKQSLLVKYRSKAVLDVDRTQLQKWWSGTSFQMQKLRDNPACAQSEFDSLADDRDPGLHYKLTFNPAAVGLPAMINLKALVSRPRVAILREQGVNGYAEMAFAFHAAGFDAVDVHMSEILDGLSLEGFRGIAACGGFSYGDVLGAGNGWAQSILMHDGARRTFENFFKRPDTFSFGICNGCQLLTRLKELIPGAEGWPTFVENTSSQFEGRFSMVRVEDQGPAGSVFFSDMAGSALPIVVSHGEGRASFASPAALDALDAAGLVPLRYVDNYGRPTEAYPANPNGSPRGIAGVRSRDGRALAMMPHPERTIMGDVASWMPHSLRDNQYGPWFRLFLNARKWVG